MKNLYLIISFLILGNLNAQNELKVGEKAPDILFEKSFPTEYEIPDKKIIVLDFWATWCGPCIASLIEHNRLVDKYSKEIEFIAITDNTSRNVSGFIKSKNFKNTFVIDRDTTTFNNYGVNGIPYLFVIDKNKVIKWAGLSRNLKENDLKKLLGMKYIEDNSKKILPKSGILNDSIKTSLDSYKLQIINKELLDKTRTILVGKIDDNGKGNYSNAPQWDGSLTVINYNLSMLTSRTQTYFVDRILVNEITSEIGYDFIQVPFKDFETMNNYLSKNYGISYKKE